MDIVVKHLHEKVPSISQLRPDVPKEIDAFMRKAMAKSPAERYLTPREFITAIEQLQQRIQTMPMVERVGAGARNKGAGSAASDAINRGDTMNRSPTNGGEKGRDQSSSHDVPTQKEARLLVLSSGQSIPLTGEYMVVGRQDPQLGIFPEINLVDKTVGRRHACLRNKQGKYTVEDLNALNKTRLNGVILTPHEERTLKDGDKLRFGSVEVRFELR